jgi:DNA-binding transcriptional ArsR family regulator
VSRIDLDDIDIGILAFLSDVPESTTSQIAKALFKPPYNLAKLDCFIRYRLRRFMETGILKSDVRSRKKIYSLDQDKVFFGDGVLKMDGVGEIKMGYFIVVKARDETVAKSIDDYERRLRKTFSEKKI